MNKLILIFAVALVVAVPVAALHSHKHPTRPVSVGLLTAPPITSPSRLLVPAYFKPDEGWKAMCSEMLAGSTAIANPRDGPGAKMQSAYAEAIKDCQKKRQKVIGYVHTEYGDQSLDTVEKQISDYYAWYPSINGIFLDEMAETPDEAYYATLERLIHAKGGTVVGNPGDTASTGWQLNVVDQIVAFEGTAASFTGYEPASWTLTAPSSRIAIIVFSATMEACTKAESDNAGSVYVTNLGEPDPYKMLPSFWASEVSSC